MKKINLVLGFCVMLFIASPGLAQDYKIPVQNVKEGKLILMDFMGELPIEGYAGSDIIITPDRVKETPERAKGLKPIFPGGTDNTGLGLSVEKDGGRITVRCLIPFTQSARFSIKVPNELALKIKSGCERSNSISVQNMKNEVEIDVCHSISLKNVTGPLVLSTISGNIDIDFNGLNKDKPLSIASVSGEIDINLPANAAVDLEMSTISGKMYSDFEFPDDKNKMKRVGGSTFNAQLNGGGVNLKINTVSGNIYLRKQKA